MAFGTNFIVLDVTNQNDRDDGLFIYIAAYWNLLGSSWQKLKIDKQFFLNLEVPPSTKQILKDVT